MTFRPRIAFLLLLALVSAALVGGCGGGDEPASSADVDQLLKDTFSGDHQITSGVMNLDLRLDAQGGGAEGPITVSLSGPFQSQGKGKLPKLDLDATVGGAGQNIKAGVTSTGDKGFVSFNGTDYAVSDEVFQMFKQSYEQAQAQAADQQGQSLATLGIDPRRWLKNPRNEGEVDIGGESAIKITGDVDVPKLLDDINTALEKARSLGVQGSQDLPEKLTEAQKQQAADAIKKLSVEIDTGKDDHILRGFHVDLSVTVPDGSSSPVQNADVSIDFQLTDVNEDQDISAPENAKPFDDLLSQLGGLQGLGGGSSSGSGSSGPGSDNLKKYSQCIQDAGNDADKARKCADLLTP